MWSPPGTTEPTLIRRYGLMMSDLRGLITKSTFITFQHIITPSVPPLLSLWKLHLTKGSDSKRYTYAVVRLPLALRSPKAERKELCRKHYILSATCQLQHISFNNDISLFFFLLIIIQIQWCERSLFCLITT